MAVATRAKLADADAVGTMDSPFSIASEGKRTSMGGGGDVASEFKEPPAIHWRKQQAIRTNHNIGTITELLHSESFEVEALVCTNLYTST